MPAEALENLILDTLETELAKIGTAPLSNWLSTTPPEVHVGAPPEVPPGPNLESIWIQFGRSEEGSDSVGVASHILHCTFGVWVFSTHAADGQRRMLNLLQDVRTCLLAAESTFFETFHYGIRLGAFDSTGHEAHIRQGLSGGALVVTVDADVEHPEQTAGGGMTEAQIRELIREETLGIRVQRIMHLSPADVLATGSTGIQSAGYNERLRGFTREIGLPSGTNKIYELYTNPIVMPIGVVTGAGFDLRCTINCPTRDERVTPTGECFIGIQMGTFGCVPPFMTNYATLALADQPVFQFRWNFTDQRFELLVWDGDTATPPDVIPTDLQVPFAPDAFQKEFRMVLDVAADMSRTIKCYLNGELAHTYSGARIQGEMLGVRTGPGIILCGGTSATPALFSDAHFYEVICLYPNFFGITPPNPLS